MPAPPPPLPPPSSRGRLTGAVVGAVAASPRLGGLPRSFWLVWGGLLVNRLGTFVMPFLTLYVIEGRGHSPGVAGAVLLAYGLAGIPSQPLGGILADSIGRIRTATAATLCASAALLALSAARTPAQLVLAAGLLGLFAEAYRPATSALVADVVAPADRPRAFGLTFWAVNLGFAAATSLGGQLAEIGWTLLFVGDAITTAAYGLILWRFVPEPPRDARVAGPTPREALRTVRRDRLLLGFLAVTVAYGVVYTQVFGVLPLVMGDVGLGEADYGHAIALNGVLIVLVQPLVIARIARWRPGAALAGGYAVLAIGVGLTALATRMPGFAATVVVWTLGEIVVSTFAAPIVADLAPPGMQGRYQGMFGLAHAVAFAIGPAAGLRLYDAAGGDAVWLSALALGLTSAAAVLLLRRGLAARRDAALLTDALPAPHADV